MERRQVGVIFIQQVHPAQEGNQQVVVDVERNVKALSVARKDRNWNRVMGSDRLISIHASIDGAVGDFSVALWRVGRLLVRW